MLYEVRTAGSSRRLYTNGVLHSQISSRCPVTGSVWDLLWLPSLLSPPGEIQRVLLLGVGAGTVIHQLQAFVQPSLIVGVECDPMHLKIAREFFDVETTGATLVEADAAQWLARYRGERFDMIIDDLCSGRAAMPHRAVPLTARWFRCLSSNLSNRGTLVINFTSYPELRDSAIARTEDLAKKFESAYELRAPHTENVVVALCRESTESADLRTRVRQSPVLGGLLDRGKLRYSIRRLSRLAGTAHR